MYSKEQRIKAVKLFVKYGMKYTSVVRELGYPNTNTLKRWYKEYVALGGDLHEEFRKPQKYSIAQKKAAVQHYLEHGKCISVTCKILGYPSRATLKEWILETNPNEIKSCKSGGVVVEYTQIEKRNAVIDMQTRTGSVQSVAEAHDITRPTLYKWSKDLLTGTSIPPMKKEKFLTTEELIKENEELVQERERLLKEVYRLQLEKDMLEKAAEIIKKDQGISLQKLKNHEKAVLIDALRPKYRLKTLLQALNMSKSSYCYQHNKIQKPDKYASLRIHVKEAFEEGRHTYGYRRIYLSLKKSGIVVSEKVIRKIMKQDNLMVSVIKKRKYNSYKGEITPAVDNVINRNFHADYPNKVWLTDITEFHIPAGKVYLSPIIDCFDGLPVAWSIGTSPDARLVNTMLDEAIQTLNENEHPIVHSDRGAHYRWPGWIDRMDAAELTRSMSKKGCSPDNAACEGFFGRLKNEMFYNRSWAEISIESFMGQLNDYIQWYATKRIKASLHGMSPLEYRANIGLVS